MTDHAPGGPPPHAVMMQMVNGVLVSRCISLVADLGIADRLGDDARSADELATETGSDADALYRTLRMLAALDIFEALPDRRFRNTPLSDALRDDAVPSVRHYARWLGTGLHWNIVRDLDHSARTGTSAVTKDDPDARPFEVLARDPGAQAVFNEAMTGLSAGDSAAIVNAYDFSQAARVIDCGGGHGLLAATIAEAAPETAVDVLDLPHVIEGTRARLAAHGLADRVGTIAGDLFESVPGPADVCVLKHIIHDWDDEPAARILESCRKALTERGRVLVCEMLVTDGPESVPAKILDIEMLAGPGGRERTEDEFRALMRRAGLELQRVIETPSPLRLLEAAVR